MENGTGDLSEYEEFELRPFRS